MTQQVLSISQINEYIRSKMDNDGLLSGLAVRGEISNYKMYPSGHHYFTLKDENASLSCVIYKMNATRLRFRPENGMKVIAMGKISVYPRDGSYKLYCSAMVLDGVGDLYAAFEQLKRKLSEKGLFDESRKKPLPKFPKTIGIITSSAGAAVHDMLRIINKRYPAVKVLLLPVRVQGTEAPGEISSAINYANHYNLADVLIVGRGGGSIEDLWAFNDERVAYAIYQSSIPVISAVGHEPDFTISDFVADVRAATPSNAAELVVPDQNALILNMDAMLSSMTSSLKRQLNASRRHLTMLSNSSTLQSPLAYYEKKRVELKAVTDGIVAAQNKILNRKQKRFVELTAKLDAMSPLKVLSRGYSMTYTKDGEILRSIHNVEKNDKIQVNLNDGSVTATVLEIKEDLN